MRTAVGRCERGEWGRPRSPTKERMAGAHLADSSAPTRSLLDRKTWEIWLPLWSLQGAPRFGPRRLQSEARARALDRRSRTCVAEYLSSSTGDVRRRCRLKATRARAAGPRQRRRAPLAARRATSANRTQPGGSTPSCCAMARCRSPGAGLTRALLPLRRAGGSTPSGVERSRAIDQPRRAIAAAPPGSHPADRRVAAFRGASAPLVGEVDRAAGDPWPRLGDRQRVAGPPQVDGPAHRGRPGGAAPHDRGAPPQGQDEYRWRGLTG